MTNLRSLARLAAACCIVAFLCIALIAPAFAADGSITFGWGDFLGQLLEAVKGTLSLLILCAILFVLSMCPAWVQNLVTPLVMTYRVDQLFANAASTAIAGVKGAIAGKEVSIPVANDLIRTTAQIAIDSGSSKVIDFAGKTVESIAQKAMARLQSQGVVFPEEYALADANQAAQAPVVNSIVNSQ